MRGPWTGKRALNFGVEAFDGAIPNRASDHDPIVIGLTLLGDLDEDGVLNGDDFCSDTMIPEAEVQMVNC